MRSPSCRSFRRGAGLLRRERQGDPPGRAEALSERRADGAALQRLIRATKALPDDPAIHRSVLAYASDLMLLDSSLIAHGTTVFDETVQGASLDHALWFHRPFRADDWLLYAQDKVLDLRRAFRAGSLRSRRPVGRLRRPGRPGSGPGRRAIETDAWGARRKPDAAFFITRLNHRQNPVSASARSRRNRGRCLMKRQARRLARGLKGVATTCAEQGARGAASPPNRGCGGVDGVSLQ